jgi:hypothetical protein
MAEPVSTGTAVKVGVTAVRALLGGRRGSTLTPEQREAAQRAIASEFEKPRPFRRFAEAGRSAVRVLALQPGASPPPASPPPGNPPPAEPPPTTSPQPKPPPPWEGVPGPSRAGAASAAIAIGLAYYEQWKRDKKRREELEKKRERDRVARERKRTDEQRQAREDRRVADVLEREKLEREQAAKEREAQVKAAREEWEKSIRGIKPVDVEKFNRRAERLAQRTETRRGKIEQRKAKAKERAETKRILQQGKAAQAAQAARLAKALAITQLAVGLGAKALQKPAKTSVTIGDFVPEPVPPPTPEPAPEPAPEPIFYGDPGYGLISGLTPLEGTRPQSSPEEVCSCRPRYSKRKRKKKGERRICYTRKV